MKVCMKVWIVHHIHSGYYGEVFATKEMLISHHGVFGVLPKEITIKQVEVIG